MKDRQDLVDWIIRYNTKALGLEEMRKGLVDKILGVVKSEIIPEISPDLPTGYSISAEDSEVVGNKNDDNAIPTSFDVWLRVHYDGKPIYVNSPYNQEVGRIQHDLRPKLEVIARKYNLSKIVPMSEPVHIG